VKVQPDAFDSIEFRRKPQRNQGLGAAFDSKGDPGKRLIQGCSGRCHSLFVAISIVAVGGRKDARFSYRNLFLESET
jgi:hypothetical protein